MEGGKPRRKSHGPFIMPDGRPLGLFLAESNLAHNERGKRGGKRRPGASKGAEEGWTSGSAARAAAAATASAAVFRAANEAEQMELEALNRVGQRRRRRFANDLLLRQMAGKLTARDMEALFKPAPFGDTGHVSALTQATSPEFLGVWDHFRSVDMDKQSRVLQKWEAHVRELQAGPHAIHNPAVDALAAWSGVSWKARRALKRANPAHVEDIELQLLAFLDAGHQAGSDAAPAAAAAGGSGGAGAEELVLELEDGFQRLLGHGLAEFHGLVSHSRLDADGVKRVVLRRRRGGEGAAPPAPLAITCSDILMLLEEGPEQGLNARVLFDAFCHGADSPSNDLAAAGAPAAAAAQEHPHHARHHHSNHHRHSHPQHQHQHAHVPHQQVAVAAL